MATIKTNWTQDEFKAYILLYAAKCDHIENRREREFILSRVDDKVYQNIHHEIDKDNDYQSIQKIISTMERFDYSEAKIEKLIAEIMQLFLADEEFDTVEQCVFMMLKRILRIK